MGRGTSRNEEVIIEAALRVMKEVGANAITIDDVAKKSGFGRSSVYSVFSNRERLFARSLLSENIATVQLISLLRQYSTDIGANRLARVLISFFRNFSDDERARLTTSIASNIVTPFAGVESLYVELQQSKRSLVSFFTSAIEHIGGEEPTLTDEEVSTRATTLYAFILGTIQEISSNPAFGRQLGDAIKAAIITIVTPWSAQARGDAVVIDGAEEFPPHSSWALLDDTRKGIEARLSSDILVLNRLEGLLRGFELTVFDSIERLSPELAKLTGRAFENRENAAEWFCTPLSKCRPQRPLELLLNGDVETIERILQQVEWGTFG